MEEIDPPVPSGEVTPPTSVQFQLLTTYAPPPPTPARVQVGYSGAPLVYLLPPATPSTSVGPVPPPYVPPSMYMPPTSVSPVSPSSNDAMRITMLEGKVNQMASDIAELMALLRGPNRASSSSIPPQAHG
ncbi:extensin-like [Punica granatum]|uniref:Extensin-like n=1 Tax=Punica granatum TaxID=22663 RepID=A0A6P8CTN8_PUNGR|nr:extensin-like [Punica granatum]